VIGVFKAVNFISDSAFAYNATVSLYASYPLASGNWVTGIGSRNTHGGYSGSLVRPVVVNADINDIAMTVLPNAPIDAATGLPVPTIAVATNGGVSVIKDDGTVVDIVTSTIDHETPKQVRIIGDRVFWLGQNNYDDGWSSAFTAKIPSADVSVNYNTGVGSLTKYTSFEWSTASFRSTNGSDILIPIAMLSPRTSVLLEAGTNDELILGGKGADDHGTVVKIEENLSNPESGMIAQIASDFATGYQVGDIKLATLSDTSTTFDTTELVTNGTFTSGVSGWSLREGNGTFSASGGQATLTYVSNSTSWRTDLSGIIAGKAYTLSFDLISASTSSVQFYYNHGSGSDLGVSMNGSTAGTYTATFTAATTSVHIFPRIHASGNMVIDNVSVRLAEQDRSVNDNGLQVFGAVTKSAVATGADLMAYSGFSSSNYLKQPYNTDLNFGTGNFCYMLWFNTSSYSTREMILRRDSQTSQTGRFAIIVETSGALTWGYEGSTGSNLLDTTSWSTSIWNHLVVLRRGSTIEMWVNGVLKDTETNTNTLTHADAPLFVGRDENGGNAAENTSLALMRVSATAPSPEQIKKIYNDEKHLFQENAKATLYGSSDAVTALAYDDDTELLHVGTSAGRSVFQGLRRIDNTTDAVGAAISASNGMVAED
jgi:hypothetical protein